MDPEDSEDTRASRVDPEDSEDTRASRVDPEDSEDTRASRVDRRIREHRVCHGMRMGIACAAS